MPTVVKLAKALEEPTLRAALIALGGGRRPMLLVYPHSKESVLCRYDGKQESPQSKPAAGGRPHRDGRKCCCTGLDVRGSGTDQTPTL